MFDESLEDWQAVDQDISGVDLDANAAARERAEQLDALVDLVFRQAGTTLGPLSSTQVPLLVFSPCHLPAPTDDISPKEVLDRLLERIEPYVAGPYVAILFAAPADSMSMPTLLSLYNSLPKSARKNLERLYIVHPPFWTRLYVSHDAFLTRDRMVRAFLSTIVSAQVSRKRKVAMVSSLSELAQALDISSVEIPQPVAVLNATIESGPGPIDASMQQFGVSLAEMTGEKGERGLPRVVSDCIRVLMSTDALLSPGLFRISASKATITLLRQLYDRGHPVTLEQWTPESAHLAAALLKSFFGSLPSPVFSSDLYPLIERCPSSDFDATNYIRDRVLPALPTAERTLLASFVQVLHEISLRRDENKMDAYNLAVCVTPVLLRSGDVMKDAKHCQISGGKGMSGAPSEPTSGTTTLGTVVRIMISQYHNCFELVPSPAFTAETPSLASPTRGSTADADETSTPPQSPSVHRRPLRSRQSTESSSIALRSPKRRGSDIIPPSVRIENGKATISIRKGAVVAASADSLEAAGFFDHNL